MKKLNVSTPKYPNTYALVDYDDYNRLNKYKWSACFQGSSIYVTRSTKRINGKQKTIRIFNKTG